MNNIVNLTLLLYSDIIIRSEWRISRHFGYGNYSYIHNNILTGDVILDDVI